MKSNKELCKEFNKLTGEKVTRFSSIRRGKERLAMVSKVTRKATARKKPMIVRVDGQGKFPSVRSAFTALHLRIKDYRKVKAKLKVQKSVSYVGYRFRGII